MKKLLTVTVLAAGLVSFSAHAAGGIEKRSLDELHKAALKEAVKVKAVVRWIMQPPVRYRAD